MPIQKPLCVKPLPLLSLASSPAAIDVGRAVTNLGEFRHYSMIYEVASATATITGDFGSAMAVDFLGLLGTNATAATTATLTLSAAPGGTDFVSATTLIRNPSPANTEGVYHMHFELPSVQTYRYFKIEIASHTGNFQCAKIVLGKKVQFASFYTKDYEFGLEDKSDFEINRFGVGSYTPGIMLRRLGMRFEWITQTDYETNWRPLSKALGKSNPAYWCFDPEPTAYRQDKCYYGKIVDPPFAKGAVKPTNVAMDYEVLSFI